MALKYTLQDFLARHQAAAVLNMLKADDTTRLAELEGCRVQLKVVKSKNIGRLGN